MSSLTEESVHRTDVLLDSKAETRLSTHQAAHLAQQCSTAVVELSVLPLVR
jgi:hypothetical protein